MGISLTGAFRSFQSVKAGVLFTSASDPLFNSVVLLIQPESGDSSIEDKSNFSQPFTVNGTPTLTSSTTIYGGQSIDFVPGDNLRFDTEPAELQSWNFSDEDYTWEYIVQFKSVTRNDMLWSHTNSFGANDHYSLYKNNDILRARARNSSTDHLNAQSSAGTFTSGNISSNWWHIAFTKEADTWRVFLDGVQVATDTTSFRYSSFQGGPFIGRLNIDFDGGAGSNMYLRSARLTEGTARYTSNFTPPSDVFPTS